MIPDKKHYTLNEILDIFEINKDTFPDIKKPRASIEELEQIIKEVKSIFKTAYRKAALKYHPDHGGNQHDFKIINNLYHFIIKSIKIRRLTREPPTAIFVRTYSYSTTDTTTTTTTTSGFYYT
jgi:hypothetical protein